MCFVGRPSRAALHHERRHYIAGGDPKPRVAALDRRWLQKIAGSSPAGGGKKPRVAAKDRGWWPQTAGGGPRPRVAAQDCSGPKLRVTLHSGRRPTAVWGLLRAAILHRRQDAEGSDGTAGGLPQVITPSSSLQYRLRLKRYGLGLRIQHFEPTGTELTFFPT